MFRKLGLAIVVCLATGSSLFAQATASISGPEVW